MTKTELKDWMWQWLSPYADQYKFMDEFDAKLDKYAEIKAENLPISGVSGSFSAEGIGHSRVKPLTRALEMIMDKINSGAPPSIEKDGEIRDIAQFALDNFR